MTVIAFRDGLMSADSLMSSGGTRAGWVRKVAKGKGGHLGGVAGEAGAGLKFLQWVEKGAKGKMPGGDISAIFVKPDGSVFLIDKTAILIPSDAPFYATGTGGDLALGVMAAGAEADEAVLAAIKFDVHCGGAVTSVRLDPVGAKPVKAKKKGKRK